MVEFRGPHGRDTVGQRYIRVVREDGELAFINPDQVAAAQTDDGELGIFLTGDDRRRERVRYTVHEDDRAELLQRFEQMWDVSVKGDWTS